MEKMGLWEGRKVGKGSQKVRDSGAASSVGVHFALFFPVFDSPKSQGFSRYPAAAAAWRVVAAARDGGRQWRASTCAAPWGRVMGRGGLWMGRPRFYNRNRLDSARPRPGPNCGRVCGVGVGGVAVRPRAMVAPSRPHARAEFSKRISSLFRRPPSSSARPPAGRADCAVQARGLVDLHSLTFLLECHG